MRGAIIRAAAAFVLAALVRVTTGAAPARAQTPTFRTASRLVVLQATVINRRGELITNLNRDDFAVFDNGRPQPITLFGREDVPVSVGLLVDNSGSMRHLRSVVEAAALAFVRASNPRDEVFVVNFADKPRIDVPFTNDIRVLETGIARVDSIGGTAMRDAVNEGEHYLHDHARYDRKVLLVISDGKDNASVVELPQIQRQAETGGVQVYAVGLLSDENPADAKRARHELDHLTDATGGLAYYPDSAAQISDTMVTIAHEIRNQYVMGFVPQGPFDGSYRRLRVEARRAEHLTVRTRPGYRATPDATRPE